jgi:hypothetical protein
VITTIALPLSELERLDALAAEHGVPGSFERRWRSPRPPRQRCELEDRPATLHDTPSPETPMVLSHAETIVAGGAPRVPCSIGGHICP